LRFGGFLLDLHTNINKINKNVAKIKRRKQNRLGRQENVVGEFQI